MISSNMRSEIKHEKWIDFNMTFFFIPFNFHFNVSVLTQIWKKPNWCNPCFFENIQVKATHFCRTCEDPEPLCKTCAREHIRHKISRDHEISDNIREFPNQSQNNRYDFQLLSLIILQIMKHTLLVFEMEEGYRVILLLLSIITRLSSTSVLIIF